MAGGRISRDDVQKVREATDLVALVAERTQVKQKGREFWACCPLHQEKTPSFKIDPVTQFWHCFGCDEGGSAFDLIMKLDDLTFPEAVRKLAERAHIEISESNWDGETRSKRQRLKDACREAAEFYHLQLMRGKGVENDKAREYLSKRGLGGDIPKKWMLGYAPGNNSLASHLSKKGFTRDEMVDANLAVPGRNGTLRDRFYKRIMFPIFDAQGDAIAFGGRIIEGDGPKYLNSQETPIFRKSQVLYGLDKAKAAMTATGTAIVTEGYTDVISMHKAGIENAVATLGTALTKSHIRILGRHAGKRIVYIFDGDAAGQRATERALQFIDNSITTESGSKQRMDVCALCLPDGMDPAEFLAAHGPDEMRALVDAAEPLILFGIKRRLERFDLDSIEGRAAALEEALNILAPIKDSITAKEYAVEVSYQLRLSEKDVLERLSKLKPPQAYEPVENSAQRGVAQGQNVPAASSRPAQGTHPMSVAERNRLKSEREFLGLYAQNPVDALQFADALSNTKWHDAAHLKIAEVMSRTLLEKLDASPAEIMEAAAQEVPNASAILTSASVPEGSTLQATIGFLANELRIGDMEDELAELRLAVRNDESGNSEAFQKMVALQQMINDMRNSQSL